MPGRNDLLIGQIALEMKLVTKEQIQEALAEQTKQDRPKPIGVILVAKGYLTDNQLVRIIDEQRRRMNEPAVYWDARKEDVLFGKLLVRNGELAQERLNAALRRQQELAEEGTIRCLGEILVEDGTLTMEAVRRTLKLQKKTIMACPSCGSRFNVVGFPSTGSGQARKEYSCKKCGMRLEVATDGVGADGTSWSMPAVKADIKEPEGERFGKFQLISRIGSGGFGTVYKAYQRDLTGITDDLARRETEVRSGEGFAGRVGIVSILYWEHHLSRTQAARRERQIKGWRREKKLALIHGDVQELRRLSRRKKGNSS